MFKQSILLSFVLLASIHNAVAQNDWHTYPFRDLETFIAGEQAMYDKTAEADLVISANPFPSKTRVIYTGKKRELSQYGRSFVRIWAESRSVPANTVDQLLEEFLFTEKGKEYWMPVQKGTAKAISSQLKEGDEVLIYYFYLGGYDPALMLGKDTSATKPASVESDKLRWLLAVERVETVNSTFPIKRLGDVIDSTKKPQNETENVMVDSRSERVKAKLVFTGQFREVEGNRKDLRNNWLTQNGASAAASLMESEGLFKEGEVSHWIILRNQTRDHLKAYVKSGNVVFLNSILAGSVKKSKSLEWIFIAGEYSTF